MQMLHFTIRSGILSRDLAWMDASVIMLRVVPANIPTRLVLVFPFTDRLIALQLSWVDFIVEQVGSVAAWLIRPIGLKIWELQCTTTFLRSLE